MTPIASASPGPPQSPGAQQGTDAPDGTAASGLRVHRSNRVEFLATVLAHNLKDKANPDAMRPEHVVVGNRGSERWLAHMLGQTLGITANVEFPFPAGIIESLVGWAVDGPNQPVPKSAAAWNKENVAWTIADELLGLPSTPLWAPLWGWMEVEPPAVTGSVDRRLLGLAMKLADVYDRLQTFRAEWTQDWAHNPEHERPEGVPEWQVVLWTRLIKRLGPETSAARMIRARDRLRQSVSPDGLPTLHQPKDPLARQDCQELHSLHIFGISSLPPIWLELLAVAGRHLNIDMYLLSPSNQYWADVRRGTVDLPSPLRLARDQLQARLEAVIPADEPVGEGRTRPNPTLATFGRIARDFQAVLERVPEGYRDIPNEGEVFQDPVPDSAEPEGESAPALKWLQSDILHMRHPADHKDALEHFERRRIDPMDDSIQVHACYGPLRQVEALRDALLDLFDRHEGLQARDVVVMCPRVADWAPLITAVFGSPDRWGGAPPVPFRLADRSLRELNPVSEALLQLMQLAQGRLTAPAVLELLGLEPVRARFGIRGEDLPAISALVSQAGARWGRDAEHRTTFDQPADPMCTWRFAMDRLALGALMDDNAGQNRLWQGISPVESAGSEGLDRIGSLLEFTSALLHHAAVLTEPRSLEAWRTALTEALDALVTATPETAFRLRQVRSAIGLLGAHSGGDLGDRPVSASAVQSWLEGQFEQPAGPLGQQTGAVTFCTMLPERGVPYAVVCLLGMDESAYPRQAEMLGFDPTTRSPRVGDRDPRDEDRYLLLEALLAAREHFLVFYTGRDQRSKEERAPAPPIGELMDVAEASFLPPEGWDDVRSWLEIQHPLQAFSPRNFTAGGLVPANPLGTPRAHRLDGRTWSFDPRLCRGAAALRRPPAPLPRFWSDNIRLDVDPEAIVELGDLIRFWRHPTRWLLQTELSIYPGDHHTTLADREPVELDHLENWLLQNQLGDLIMADDNLLDTTLMQQLWARGDLPPGTLGRVSLHAAESMVRPAVARLRPHLHDPHPVPVQLTLGEWELRGQVPGVGPDGVARLVLGAIEGRKLVEAWFLAAAVTGSGRPCALHVAPTKPAKGEDLATLLPFGGDAANAKAWLLRRVQGFHEGRRRPLPFLARASWALANRKMGRGAPPIGLQWGYDNLPSEAREAGLTAAREHWYGSDRLTGEAQDAAVVAVLGTDWPYPEDSASEAEFITLALDFWGPVLQARSQA